MTTPADDEDIKDVMAEEKSRGTKRRPVDSTERRERRLLEADLLRALSEGDFHAYVQQLEKAGLRDGTPEYANALKIFHSWPGRR